MPLPRPLRIGIDARPLLEPRGGLRRYLESILPALYATGPEVHWRLFLPKRLKLPGPVLPPGGHITIVPGAMQAWLRLPWEEWLLPRALASNGIDVLFSPYGAVPRRSSCPVVATIHDLYFKLRPSSLGLGHRRYWNSVASRAHRAALVLTPSESVRRDAVALLDLSPDRVIVTPHGVSPAFRPAGGDEPVRELIPPGMKGPYLLTFGPWTARKNLDLLEEATRGLTDQDGQAVRLAVAGSVPARHRSDHVFLLGVLSDHELASVMRGAALSCVPSLHEGFGLPDLEAMACGRSVLVSGEGALPEVVAGAGRVVESHDPLVWRRAIAELLAFPLDRRRMALAGIERSRLFSWERAAQLTCGALMRAAADPMPREGRCRVSA